MGRSEFRRIGRLIDEVLTRRDDATIARVRGEVKELTQAFPLYQARRA
jgi:glycine/serine hydroxymethyltransferase